MVLPRRVIHGSVEAHRQVSPKAQFLGRGGVSLTQCVSHPYCSQCTPRLDARLQWGLQAWDLKGGSRAVWPLRREEGDQLSSKLLSLAPTEV